jgi:cobalt-zinc-cadmium efflux system outer membrane protein
MSPGLGFDEVSREVQARTGAVTRWDRGTAEDQQARAAVRDLLAKELTADAAVQVALLNNRDLQATYEDLDIAQADLVRAGLLRNPVFSGELRFDTAGGGTGIVLDVTQEFLSLFTMPLRRAKAGAAFEAAKARVTRAAVETAFETRAAFYDFQAAEEVRNLRATIVEVTAASTELAQRIYDAGNTRELDLLGEQAMHEQAKLDSDLATNSAAQARERLNVLMGVWGPDTGWAAAARLPSIPDADEDAESLERRVVAQSLELAEARAQIDQAAVAARLARPLVWLEGSEVGAAAERETEGGWSVGPSVSVPIPIFDSGGAAAGESAARLRQAAHRYYAAAVRVRASARAAAAALKSARARVLQHTTVLLPLHARLVESAQLQYNAMQISPLQLLQVKRDQIAAGVSSVQALRDYWTAHAGVQRALAGTPAPMFPSAQRSDQTTITSAEGGAGGH